ncbi:MULTISPECIES: helix-turn-helix transcriptional regulator [unclassified Cryobacterium]|uniref:helix-turn-helix domain-containing protein n=1 Tax=unclassified Cryobacterium TaxID=2649013 RepID=UPI002AB3D0F0|nr:MULTISPECIES: helix-turn-helix transcriptional regulator [unclassified Cryobacterium]MDY7528334.1 helix-turn-helix transcriptional regulator [Cryobacterium sp. 10C2]MDY7542233.1 helix-turn-helix transcriptional regulator [Cryobacterium sp. 5B3]MDY7544400.1 helix-turn-helix transcriptional regulator [Cryobacterium sp. 5B3]MDY7544474.1 helix-turn-helix transcriptional regulator [Cryobacterium sp. 5B3]MDY7555921.1 helix-turn-helix transcriptional regulator [Cryobacterium sp. 10C3]
MAEFRWRLRMAAAQREVWTGAQLRRLLVDKAGLELSSASISALMTQQPSQIKLATLAALCQALDCTANDLLELDTTTDIGNGTPPTPVTQEPLRAAAGQERSRASRNTPPPF